MHHETKRQLRSFDTLFKKEPNLTKSNHAAGGDSVTRHVGSTVMIPELPAIWW